MFSGSIYIHIKVIENFFTLIRRVIPFYFVLESFSVLVVAP